jgi:hypothetical protein
VISSAYSRSPPTGSPDARRVTRTPEGLQQAGHVHRGGVPLEVRVRGQDDLRDPIAAHPFEQLSNPEVVRSDAVHWRDGAPQDVVPPSHHGGFLHGRDVLRFLHHAHDLLVSRRIGAVPAQLAFGHAEALPAEVNALLRLDDCIRQALGVSRRRLHQVERETLGGLGPDPREPVQLVDEVLDRPLEHLVLHDLGAELPPKELLGGFG